MQPEAKTNRAGVGPGPKAGGKDPQDRRQSQFRNQHKPKIQKTRKPSQPRQIPRPHTVVLGQHVGLLVLSVFWLQHALGYMGGGQYQWDRRSRSIQPEAKTNRAGAGPRPKAGGKDPQDRRQGQFRNQYKPKNKKKKQPNLDKYQGHIRPSWDNTLFFLFVVVFWL